MRQRQAFVGRVGVIDRLLDALATGTSVLVIGPRSSGKTRLLRELPGHVGRGKTIDYAAGEWPDGDAVLLVDDVDVLDPSAAATLARRLGDHPRPVVLTAARRGSVPSVLAPVIERAVVIDLPPLDALTVERLLVDALGPVTGLLTETVVAQAAGNPGLVARIVTDLRTSGRLIVGEDVTDIAPGSDIGPEMLELAERILNGLPDEERDALRSLAVTGPARAVLLPLLHPPEIWTEVERGRWIRRVTDPLERHQIVLFNEPIVGQAIAHLAPLGYREKVQSRIVALAEQAGLLGTIGTHRALARSAGPFDPQVLLAAAQSARRLHDFEDALELATRVERHREVDDLQLAEAATVRGFVWRYRWQHDDALAELDEARDVTRPSLGERVEAGALWTETHSQRAEIEHFLTDDPGAALAELERGIEIAEDLQSVAAVPATRAALRRSANDLRAHRLLHLAWSGQHVRFQSEARSFRARSRQLQVRLRAAGVISEGMTGRPRQAYRRAVRSYIGGVMLGTARTWADEEMDAATLLVSAQHHGPASVIRTLAERAHDVHMDPFAPYQGLMVRLLMSHIAFLTGDAEEALAYAETARSTMHTHDPGGARRIAAFARAQALALMGRGREAREELASAQAMPLLAAAFNRGAEARATFVVRLCTEESRGVLGDLLEESDSLADEGLYGVAVDLLHWGVRFGDHESATRLLDMSRHIEGDVWELMIEHARVLLTPDPTRCLALATRAAECGLNDVAAELCALGERQAAALGLPGVAEACRRRYAVALGLVRVPGSPLLGEPAASLTRRELQIARRASTGATAKQMAAELHLSRRTVEGHLARIYTKLGISHRRDLAL